YPALKKAVDSSRQASQRRECVSCETTRSIWNKQMLHLSFHLILRRLPTTPIGLDRSEIRCAEFIQARLESVVVRLARVSGGEELPTLRLESVC
ncbi:UNVERIFIED_CONTAM: hypothetical protein LI985_09445, partial [Campylobacter jejuni]